VYDHHLLMVLAGCVAAWQVCYCAALVVTILVATRTLGISARSVGLCYVGLGAGTVFASLVGGAISRRIGPGPCLALGFGICACSWLLLAAARIGPMGVAMIASSLMLLGLGAVIIFVNFISLRQAVTPSPMLGRMTTTMRWVILVPAGPGALIGGWLGQHAGLQTALGFAGFGGVLLTLVAWRNPLLRATRSLPVLSDPHGDMAVEVP
jgi:predicted MFS family arabinose efflux permease